VEFIPGTEQCCGSSKYNIATQFCSNGIHNKCGGTVEFIPGTEQCCGSSKYNIATQYCYDISKSKVGDFCGSRPETFDPDLYECRTGTEPNYNISYNRIYLKGGLKDVRDNKIYEAVLIGNQTWMALNLNYKTDDGTSRCYPNTGSVITSDEENSNCNGTTNTNAYPNYGRYYNWALAMGLAYSHNSTIYNATANYQGICPSGWHLPSEADWTALMKYIKADCTKPSCSGIVPGTNEGIPSTLFRPFYGYGCVDTYGFGALHGGVGYDNSNNGNVSFTTYKSGTSAFWWSTLESANDKAYTFYVYKGTGATLWGADLKSSYRNVRCLKD